MEPKFKVGQKVVVVDVEGSCATGISNGDILTVEGVWQDADGSFGYDFKESGYALLEHRLGAYEEKKTAEEIAPILWQSYCNVLNEEALSALRQVIEDVENHERMYFTDSDVIAHAFTWRQTKQGYRFWNAVDDGEFDKTAATLSQELQENEEDIGSAATSKHYNSKLIQPIEIAQMVLTPEEFQGAMKFNIMKYTQRAGSKEGESSQKDWNKALQYQLWLELAKQGKTIDPRNDVV